MIYKEITNEHEFANWLSNSDNYKNKFTFEGADAIQQYYADLSESLGENISFSPIAWCCEWSEYANLVEAFDDYADIDKLENYEGKLEYFQDRTTVIELENSVLIIAF